ncbi:SBBP repeat-containing protein [Solimonas marina]|uniref:Choice-of-anchor D domain-containing protein n=1 Tax=Solimonas marina TaxID=2714601 RepID=A0A969W730_9GAMM|nr:SBBP repeat-containing protein [Solimonas marina]NKF20800.1 choice-of-anchor D domain-containing protein [Solimonas marina]
MRRSTAVFIGMALVIPLAAASLYKTPQRNDRSPRLQAARQASSGEPARALQYGKIPLHFEPNEGQAPQDVRYIARGAGYGLFLKDDEAVLSLLHPAADTGHPTAGAVLRMQLVGAQKASRLEGEQPLRGQSNYLQGGSAERWQHHVAHVGRVHYSNVYDGVDLVYYGNQNQLEYDFIVAPGKSPQAIRLHFAGADHLSVDTDGNLHIATAGGELVEHQPVVYQRRDGRREAVQGAFRLEGRQDVAFAVGPYDDTRELVIDPTLDYSTYLGGVGTGADYGRGIAVDSDGDAYVTGYTASTNYPTTSGAYQVSAGGGSYDAFVTKVAPDGESLIYSTYFGGSSSDYGRAIAVDTEGQAYVAGYTASSDFPITAGAYQTTFAGGSYDGFVAKLSADGSSLVYSTYIGGSSSDYLRAMTLASDDSVYVAGYTGSSDFPTTSGAYQSALSGSSDAVIAHLSADGASLVASTLLGGSAYDYIYDNSIKTDADGAVYVTGITSSTDFPISSGAYQSSYAGDYDAFVAKLSSDLSAVSEATYFGGSDEDYAYALALDSSGDIYIGGYTESSDLPVTDGAYQTALEADKDSDMYVAKFEKDLSGLVYSTYIGGASYDYLYGLAVDEYGYAYGAGYSNTSATPLVATDDAYQTSISSGYDIFAFKLSKDGSTLKYGTYLGGNGTDRAYAQAFANNALYGTGQTVSTDFPTTDGAYQASNDDAASDSPSYLYKLTFQPISLAPYRTDFGSVGVETTSDTQTITVSNASEAALSIDSVSVSSGFTVASDSCTGTSLVATDDTSGGANSCTLELTAAPEALGSNSGTLTVTSGSTTVTSALSATGTPLELSSRSIDFGDLAVGDSAQQTITVTNKGESAVSISSVSVTSIYSQSSDCVQTLAVGSSCTIDVSVSPTSAGTFSSAVTIVSDSVSSPDTVSLSVTGTGTAGTDTSGTAGGGALGGGTLLMLGTAALLRRRRRLH